METPCLETPSTAPPLCLAVNGTLMRGLELNGNMDLAGARFIREAWTEPTYRLWSINDRHPAMLRVAQGGAAIAVELWEVPASGLSLLLQLEPPGLCIGKVRLSEGEEVLGVLGEAILCEGQKEITAWGGWRAYMMRNPMTEVSNDHPEPATPAAFVDQMAACVGLPIPEEYRQGVIDNFARIQAIAALVTEFPLPDGIEAGPTFDP